MTDNLFADTRHALTMTFSALLHTSAGVPAGPKTGGKPLVPRLVPRRQRIVIFPLERSRAWIAREWRRETDGERTDLVYLSACVMLLVLLVDLQIPAIGV